MGDGGAPTARHLPSFYAFSYTVPSESRAARSFVAAGSGELADGMGDPAPDRCAVVILGGSKLIGARGAFLEPLPPLKHYEPPRATAGRTRRG